MIDHLSGEPAWNIFHAPHLAVLYLCILHPLSMDLCAHPQCIRNKVACHRNDKRKDQSLNYFLVPGPFSLIYTERDIAPALIFASNTVYSNHAPINFATSHAMMDAASRPRIQSCNLFCCSITASLVSMSASCWRIPSVVSWHSCRVTKISFRRSMSLSSTIYPPLPRRSCVKPALKRFCGLCAKHAVNGTREPLAAQEGLQRLCGTLAQQTISRRANGGLHCGHKLRLATSPAAGGIANRRPILFAGCRLARNVAVSRSAQKLLKRLNGAFPDLSVYGQLAGRRSSGRRRRRTCFGAVGQHHDGVTTRLNEDVTSLEIGVVGQVFAVRQHLKCAGRAELVHHRAGGGCIAAVLQCGDTASKGTDRHKCRAVRLAFGVDNGQIVAAPLCVVMQGVALALVITDFIVCTALFTGFRHAFRHTGRLWSQAVSPSFVVPAAGADFAPGLVTGSAAGSLAALVNGCVADGYAHVISPLLNFRQLVHRDFYAADNLVKVPGGELDGRHRHADFRQRRQLGRLVRWGDGGCSADKAGRQQQGGDQVFQLFHTDSSSSSAGADAASSAS
nr:MAG TPA: hypothetical protein [Bacteriophage sp.]